MGNRLKDKVAIVTGAGSVEPGWGNGKATAVLFAREGAKVLAVDVNLAAAEETKSIIDSEGGICTVCSTDVTKTGEVKAMADLCVATYGRIDILHNNVGNGDLGGPVETSEDSWHRILDLNLTSIFLTCKHVLPYMEKQGKGCIINVSSIAGIRWNGVPSIGYQASKAGVNHFSRCVALQYATKNIRVNCVVVGQMNTPLVMSHIKGFSDEQIKEIIKSRDNDCPTGKQGDAWDIAYAALFLASEESKYITGELLVVDGGLTCKCK